MSDPTETNAAAAAGGTSEPGRTSGESAGGTSTESSAGPRWKAVMRFPFEPIFWPGYAIGGSRSG